MLTRYAIPIEAAAEFEMKADYEGWYFRLVGYDDEHLIYDLDTYAAIHATLIGFSRADQSE